jgi:hypothetical protein
MKKSKSRNIHKTKNNRKTQKKKGGTNTVIVKSPGGRQYEIPLAQENIYASLAPGHKTHQRSPPTLSLRIGRKGTPGKNGPPTIRR